jgi:ribosomal-protein-alanine N-acetyltransferase
MNFPFIKTERLVLREITEADTQRIFEIFSDDRVTEFYDCDSYTNIEQARSRINWVLGLYKDEGKTGFRWSITLAENPSRLIGTCGYHYAHQVNKSFEIGYDLDPEHWGKGLMTEAVSAMIGYCYRNDFPFDVNRIRATTNLDSDRSISVLKNLGFMEEGILREAGFWKNRFHDLRLFSLLRREWVDCKIPKSMHQG